ncbi:hypothetical protein PAXRUDRAFT_169556 [Paxillus rubicundulus Ve08.2h10]|uniref:Uncharacterized protein n=1 Tax=Paxillus rubicundulus Ve08.2h10 TaxID=930991 RepID=A0A0D0BZS0_9AGAM|nr:hypothetical protein PAXRUDRAFT_169556 [Paxillus rubicundulus Ve08.2h10]
MDSKRKITENKHICAVKNPWHRSSQNESLGQMLIIDQHLDKLASFHAAQFSEGENLLFNLYVYWIKCLILF